MMEIKVNCACGQKYSFDTEPVNGRMPNAINCPVCGADGTDSANAVIARALSASAVAAPASLVPTPPAPAAGGLRINRHAPPPPPAAAATPAIPPPVDAPSTAPAPRRFAPAPAQAPVRRQSGQNSLVMGVLGAVLGAGLGSGLVYGFAMMTGFNMPFSGLAIGTLSGFGARILYRGTDTTLGIMAAMISLLATATTMHILFGDFAAFLVITMLVSTVVAYRIAS